MNICRKLALTAVTALALLPLSAPAAARANSAASTRHGGDCPARVYIVLWRYSPSDAWVAYGKDGRIYTYANYTFAAEAAEGLQNDYPVQTYVATR